MRNLAIVTILALFQPTLAFAHEFTLFYLVPPETSEAERAEIETSFQIASHERDAHPDETSDGHLGGVDVHLSVLSVTPDTMLMTLQPDVVAVPVSWEGQGEALDRFSQTIIALPPTAKKAAAYLAVPGAPDLPDFATAYQQEAGQPSGEWGRAAYVMARQIDEAVRPFDGVEPRSDVQAAFESLQTP